MSEQRAIKTNRDLIVWQKAHEMDLKVIDLVAAFPRQHPFWVIGDQLLRASTSISANIAEGHSSYRGKEYGKFLSYALRLRNRKLVTQVARLSDIAALFFPEGLTMHDLGPLQPAAFLLPTPCSSLQPAA